MEERAYYEAYDDRYSQIHSRNLRWFAQTPSLIVAQVIKNYGIGPDAKLLEIGCGEGRDAGVLLEAGFSLLATDVSPAAINFCRREQPAFAGRYQVLDCLKDNLPEKFDFLFAVAVLHMLVKDADRQGFCRFVRSHLKESGIGLICTMGDGVTERQSDISAAFDLQERIHEQTGLPVRITSTSCRVVSEQTFRKELEESGLKILEQGRTAVEPDFPQMLFAVVAPCENI